MRKISAAIYAVGHFLVDFSCALVMFSRQPEPIWFLVYNFCAFAMQMPIGFLADRHGGNRLFAMIGIALVFGGLLPLPAAVSVILIGLGNALYHVGGGRDALLRSRKMTALGIFVSPGAVGIWLGGLFCGAAVAHHIAAWALIPCFIGLLTLCSGEKVLRQIKRASLSPAALMLAVVLLRSLVGLTMMTPWKVGIYTALGALAGALGKALGGAVGDHFGGRRTGAFTLIAAAVLFCFPDAGIAGVLGVVLFNMTMPITLRRASDALPGLEGTAFGMLTLGLFLGFLPKTLGLTIRPITAALLSLLSAGLIWLDKE